MIKYPNPTNALSNFVNSIAFLKIIITELSKNPNSRFNPYHLAVNKLFKHCINLEKHDQNATCWEKLKSVFTERFDSGNTFVSFFDNNASDADNATKLQKELQRLYPIENFEQTDIPRAIYSRFYQMLTDYIFRCLDESDQHLVIRNEQKELSISQHELYKLIADIQNALTEQMRNASIINYYKTAAAASKGLFYHFVPFSTDDTPMKKYFKEKHALYFAKENNTVPLMLKYPVIFIYGNPGSGKTFLSYHIAEQLLDNDTVHNVYYYDLKYTQDIQPLIEDIQSIKSSQSQKNSLWILDNANDIQNLIFHTRSLKAISGEKFIFISHANPQDTLLEQEKEEYETDNEQFHKQSTDERLFSDIIKVNNPEMVVSDEQVKSVFRIVGGNLRLLYEYLSIVESEDIGHINIERFLKNVYGKFFIEIDKLVKKNNQPELIKLLLMFSLDFEVHIDTLGDNDNVDNFIERFIVINDGLVQFEHASLAELLLSSYANENKLSFKYILTNTMESIFNEPLNPLLTQDEKIRRVNQLLVNPLNHAFVLPSNSGIKSVFVSCEDTISGFLRSNYQLVSISTWRLLLRKHPEYAKVFVDNCNNSQLFTAMKNSLDFNIRFISSFDEQAQSIVQDELQKDIINIAKFLLVSDAGSSFMPFAIALTSDDLYCEFINAINFDAFFEYLTDKVNNVFSYHLNQLSDKRKVILYDKLEINKIIDLLNNHISLRSYGFLYSNAPDRYKEALEDRSSEYKENMIVKNINNLFSNMTLNSLFNTLESNSVNMQKCILSAIDSTTAEYIINNTTSIGALGIKLRKNKSAIIEFESVFSANHYVTLIKNNGDIISLLGILGRSSKDRCLEILANLSGDIADFLANETIRKRHSIGTLGVKLRDLGDDIKNRFEKVVGVENYARLIRQLANLEDFMNLHKNSSKTMKWNLITTIQGSDDSANRELLNRLLQKTDKIERTQLSFLVAQFEAQFDEDISKHVFSSVRQLGQLLVIIRENFYAENYKIINILYRFPDVIDMLYSKTLLCDEHIGNWGRNLADLRRRNFQEVVWNFENQLGAKRYTVIISRKMNIRSYLNILATSYLSNEIYDIIEHNNLMPLILSNTDFSNSNLLSSISETINDANSYKNEAFFDCLNKIETAVWLRLFSNGTAKKDQESIMSCLSIELRDAIISSMEFPEQPNNA